MKQLFLLMLANVCLFTVARAQTHPFRKFGAGIYAGPQISGKINTFNKLSKISGVTAGLDIRYALSREPEGFSLHLQPGFNTFRYYHSEGDNSPFFQESTWKWQAVHLPLLVRYTISSGRVRPFGEIGPMFRIRTALSLRDQANICGVAGCFTRDITQDLHPGTGTDPIGLTAGAGVEVDVWKVTIPVSVRIQEGFGTTATREQIADGLYYSSLKTRTIQVIAGISF